MIIQRGEGGAELRDTQLYLGRVILREAGGIDSVSSSPAEMQTCFCQLGSDMKNTEMIDPTGAGFRLLNHLGCWKAPVLEQRIEGSLRVGSLPHQAI